MSAAVRDSRGLADRVRRVGMSATLRVSGRAKQLRADGVDVLDFSVGEPDQPTPLVAKDAGKQAIDADRTRYTANEGLIELRRTIAAKLESDNGLRYEPDEILVSAGAKASLYFAAMALFQDGDEVVIPSPYWVSYPEQVRLAGAEPRIVAAPEAEGFKITAELLAQAIGPRTRAVILNYPSNPTGACYDADELAALAELCIARDLQVIADEIYEKLLYDGRRFASIAGVRPGMQERTIVVNGVSKAYSMTGWRIGYAAGPREVVAAMAKVQSHCTSNATSISQWASLEALRAAKPDVQLMLEQFTARRDEMLQGLQALPGVRCVRPEGAFYAFPNVSALFGRRHRDRAIESAEDLALYLLDEARVAVVPGGAFGAPEHLRISYACSNEQIREGLQRIRAALETLE